MIIKIWDWLFTRRVWTTERITSVYATDDETPIEHIYILRDQFGNIKTKRVAS